METIGPRITGPVGMATSRCEELVELLELLEHERESLVVDGVIQRQHRAWGHHEIGVPFPPFPRSVEKVTAHS